VMSSPCFFAVSITAICIAAAMKSHGGSRQNRADSGCGQTMARNPRQDWAMRATSGSSTELLRSSWYAELASCRTTGPVRTCLTVTTCRVAPYPTDS
jgi:hypothetical protein